MKLETRTVGDAIVFSVDGPVTIGHEPILEKAFDRAWAEGRRKFVFDFLRSPYADSASIGQTVACIRQAREQGGAANLVVAPGGKIRQMLRIAELDRALDLFASEAEALENLG